MLGAIAGDIIGSIYEARPIKGRDFPLFGAGATFTDESVCTLAIAGAQATVLAMWPGRQNSSPQRIRDAVERRFGYDLASSIDDIRPRCGFDVSAQGMVPPALIAALDASPAAWSKCCSGCPTTSPRRQRRGWMTLRAAVDRFRCSIAAQQ